MPDLSLPSRSPTADYSNEDHDTDKVAVYTLVDLGDEGIDGLSKAMSSSPDDYSALPPTYDFKGKSLKTIYDYHIEEIAHKRLEPFHPCLFVVAQNEGYKQDGVLLVNLSADLEGQVDTCRIAVSEVLDTTVGLQMAEADWEEVKARELPEPKSTTK